MFTDELFKVLTIQYDQQKELYFLNVMLFWGTKITSYNAVIRFKQ